MFILGDDFNLGFGTLVGQRPALANIDRRQLTGVLADGTPIDTELTLWADTQVILAPPGTPGCAREIPPDRENDTPFFR